MQLRRYCWKPTGQEMTLYHNPRKTSIATIAALDVDGLVYVEHMPRTVDHDVFIGFIKNLMDVIALGAHGGAH